MTITETSARPWTSAVEHGWIGDCSPCRRRSIADRRPARQPGRRHAALRRARLANRYSAIDTIREQGPVYLTTGSRAAVDQRSTCSPRSSTTPAAGTTPLGGACSQESNVVRYGEHTRHQHACRADVPPVRRARAGIGPSATSRHNINFFMNVPVTPDGGLTFEDGVSAPGKYVELRAERDITGPDQQLPAAQQPLQRLEPDADPAASGRRAVTAAAPHRPCVDARACRRRCRTCPAGPGYWDVGVPPSGAWDDLSFALANARGRQRRRARPAWRRVLRGPMLRFAERPTDLR